MNKVKKILALTLVIASLFASTALSFAGEDDLYSPRIVIMSVVEE
ncbi:hypothetical protein QE109_05090 [Fusibacter bizertensis]|uniref:Uncharacterized protein n=1 Tax=Fusibacter bizertensis TaxID=1488331 RepID=A0ABT6NAR3_9FIRM|nr:hypothetical protein [Fusibacter bizertensis]MDH8677510.1 hypothetical protein [Fusibacter bizertensis]